jgi:hypothetical protein
VQVVRHDTGPGWEHPAWVLPQIAKLAAQDATDPTVRRWALRAVKGVGRDDVLGEAQALARAALRDIRYTRDPVVQAPGRPAEGHEWVQAPRHTLADGGGDCDDLTGLLSAAEQGIGRLIRYRVGAYQPDQPRHVWVEVQSPRGWITIDTVPRVPRVGVGTAVHCVEVRTWDSRGRQVDMAGVCPFLRSGTGASCSSCAARTMSGGCGLALGAHGGGITPGGGNVARVAGGRTRGGAPTLRRPVVFRTARVQRGMGSTTGTALDVAQTAMASAGPYGAIAATILSFGRKLLGFLTSMPPHDSFGYLMRWLAENRDPKTTLPKPGDTSPAGHLANLTALIQNGWILVYCSDSAGTRDNVWREFGARGWQGERKADRFPADKLGITHSTYHAVFFRLSDAPAEWRAKAAAHAAQVGHDQAMQETVKFLTDAKHSMRTYGGDENYDRMMLAAIPVATPEAAGLPAAPPAGQARVAGPGEKALAVTPQAVAAPAMRAAAAAPRAVGPVQVAPAGTVPPQMRPGAAAAPARAPAIVFPPGVAQLVGALQFATAQRQARAAQQGAAAFLRAQGISADATCDPTVSSCPPATSPASSGGGFDIFHPGTAIQQAVQAGWQAATAAGPAAMQAIRTGAAAAAAPQLEHLARQLVYSVSNNRPPLEVQSRALRFQAAAGLPQTGNFDAATRDRCAQLIAPWVGAIPLRTWSTVLPQAQAAAALPAAPSETGLPAAPVPGAQAAAPAAGGPPRGGGILIAPAGTMPVGGAASEDHDRTALVLSGLALLVAMRKGEHPARSNPRRRRRWAA